MAGRDPALCSPRDHISTSTHQERRPEPGSLLTFLPRFPKSVPANAWMVPCTSRTPNKKVSSLALRVSRSAKTGKCGKTKPYAPLPLPRGHARVSRGPREAGSVGVGGCYSSVAPPMHPAGCRATQPHLRKHMEIRALYTNLCKRPELPRAGRSAPEGRCRPRYKATAARPSRRCGAAAARGQAGRAAVASW